MISCVAICKCVSNSTQDPVVLGLRSGFTRERTKFGRRRERGRAIRPRTASEPLGKNEEEREREGGRSARRLGKGHSLNDVRSFPLLLNFTQPIAHPQIQINSMSHPQCGRHLSKDPSLLARCACALQNKSERKRSQFGPCRGYSASRIR